MNSPLLPTVARLSHLVDDPLYDKEVPYEIWADKLSPGATRSNVRLNIVPDCPLTDVRALNGGERPTLEKSGFEWIYQKFPYHTGLRGAENIDTTTPENTQVLDNYLHTMKDFLKETLGCTEAICWDWRVRRSKMTSPRNVPNIYSLKDANLTDVRSNKINSSHIIHADGSPQWIQAVISKVMTQNEMKIVSAGNYRTRVLTVWRPLVDVVQTDPLVCCDTQTVRDADFDVVQKIMDETVEESMYLKWSDRHRWYWMSDQTRDDVIVMTVWDSKRPNNTSAAVPHCSMVLPEHAPNAQPRESVELRFVIWNEE